MSFKPFVFSATLAVTTETIVHKEQTPHPVEEHIQQDPVTGAVKVYQINGSTIVNVTNYREAVLAIRDVK